MSLPNTYPGIFLSFAELVGSLVLTIHNKDPVRIAVVGGTGISHLEHEGFTVSFLLASMMK